MAHFTGFDEVSVGNMALSHIGARSNISSLSEDSPEAAQINLWLPFSRAQFLQAFDWSFARKREDAVDSNYDPPEDVWIKRYQYPSDCIALRKIVNPYGKDADAVPFELESDPAGNKTVLTNMKEAKFVYTFDNDDLSKFHALAIESLSYRLASNIAISLTGKTEIRNAMLEMVRLTMMSATAHDANERVGDAPRDAEWIRARDFYWDDWKGNI